MKNLQLKISINFFLLLVLSLLFLITIIELALRIDSIESKMDAPSFGSENRQFEIQLARLKAIYEREGAIECVFIGDSLVWLDLDPISFSKGYKTKTGEEISCINFGLAGLPAYGVSVLTEILINEYKPKLLVYGLHANAVVIPSDHADVRDILGTPWVEYKNGKFNLEGWLYEKSYLVRYHKILSRILKLDQEALINASSLTPQNIRGFDPKTGHRTDVIAAPNRQDPADLIGFEKYYDYRIYPENLQGIEKIASYAENGTRVVMIMMPVHDTFFGFFRNGDQDYLEIAREIQKSIPPEGAAFRSVSDAIQFSDDEWWDYSHLNIMGAERLSFWLGQDVGMLESESD
jgi:hypothetical protein